MDPQKALSIALDPGHILRAQGLTPDPWQADLLLSQDRQILLNCSRQSGKSTVVAALALHTALFRPGALVLLLSPTQRQSYELFRKVLLAYNHLGRPIETSQDAQTISRLELANGSRVVGLPGKEATIRSFSNVTLLVLDEAARVSDDLYRSVRPMLAVSQGRLVALSTPYGQRGWFYEEWDSDRPWKRVKVTWKDCARILPEFIEQERASIGESWVQQEYECCFTAMQGLVYPTFQEACYDIGFPTIGPQQQVGGLDFGWRNPFAAIWGVLDYDGVLWIEHERYLRETALHEHMAALPKSTLWYADPAGADQIALMRAHGFKIRRGANDIRLGIALVAARVRTGRLKVRSNACPNLIAEAKLYRYPSSDERAIVGENPINEHNHALGALRYLISRLDARKLRYLKGKDQASDDGPIEGPLEEELDKDDATRSIFGVSTWRDEDPDIWTIQ